jgi:anionic cell wall polymer biosynthesis LytR-Cps2A-Psr (LCP) family protein
MMIDEAVREAFARHADLVPDASPLKHVIDSRTKVVRARRRKIRSVAAVFTLVVLLVVPMAVVQKFRGEPLIPGTGPANVGPAATNPMNLLILGVDGRAPQAADAILMIHVEQGHKRAWAVSVSRDLSVNVPGHEIQHINSAYRLGGYDLTAKTLAKLTGVTFDAGVVVNFDGIQKIVSAVGGVDMCVDERTVSMHIGYDKQTNKPKPPYRDGKPVPGVRPAVYEVGCQHFAGWQALDYVRQGDTLPGGQQDRNRHLRQLLGALVEKLGDPVNLAKVLPLLSSALDAHLNGASMADLAAELHDVDTSNVHGLRLPDWPTKDKSGTVAQPDTASFSKAMRDDKLGEWADAHPDYGN